MSLYIPDIAPEVVEFVVVFPLRPEVQWWKKSCRAETNYSFFLLISELILFLIQLWPINSPNQLIKTNQHLQAWIYLADFL